MKERKFLFWHLHTWGSWRVEGIKVPFDIYNQPALLLHNAFIKGDFPTETTVHIQERRCQTCGERKRKPL